MSIENSKKLYKEAVKILPGGVNSPVRAFKSVGGSPLFMKKGEGPYLIDEDDNKYIDYCMSWGPLLLGHADEDVVATVINSAKNGMSFGTPNKYEVEIAKKVCDRYPSIEMIRFVSSGTEATMSAIRLARGYTGREKIIKFDGCYHGHADHLLVASGSGLATFGTPDSAGVTKDNVKDTIVVPFNDLDKLKEILKSESSEVAAIILEPVPCNYGLIPVAKEYLQSVRDLCDKYNVLLIFDEVITGFRLSKGGAQKFYDIKPDITTLGKIIGGGLPVGAYGASKKIMEKIAPLGPVYQAGTLSGNPLAMAAGIATLDKIDKVDAYTLLKEKADLFKEFLKPALEKYKGKVLFLQVESIFAFYFTSLTEINNVDQVRSCDMEMFSKFHTALIKKGIYFSPSGYEVGFISTVHTDEVLKETAQAIADVLDEIF